MSFPKIGNLAPSFNLQDQMGNTCHLKDYKGSIVVLYFYPKAMTPGCTIQAAGIRDSHEQLAKLGVKVLGVSIDAFKRLAKFADRDDLNFTLLSDEDHAVCDKYGVWGLKKFMGKEYMGINRMTFIIDADGRLQYIMEKVKTKSHHEDVINYITEHML